MQLRVWDPILEFQWLPSDKWIKKGDGSVFFQLLRFEKYHNYTWERKPGIQKCCPRNGLDGDNSLSHPASKIICICNAVDGSCSLLSQFSVFFVVSYSIHLADSCEHLKLQSTRCGQLIKVHGPTDLTSSKEMEVQNWMSTYSTIVRNSPQMHKRSYSLILDFMPHR